MKILAIIPARGGSKGVPRKNVKDLNGKPLIAYTVEAAKKSKFINRMIVSTDDKEIAEVSQQYGAEIPYLRPSELASDVSPTIDSIIHLLTWLKAKEDYEPDYVCLLQCTSPLRTYEDIDNTIEKMLSAHTEAALSVCEADTNPYWTNVFNGDKLEYFIKEGKNITRRQDLPKIYAINGAVYVIKTSTLLKEKTFEVENTTGYIMCSDHSVDIDTNMDFHIAELILKEMEQAK